MMETEEEWDLFRFLFRFFLILSRYVFSRHRHRLRKTNANNVVSRRMNVRVCF